MTENVADTVPNSKQEITQVIVKERKMDGMDPGLIALLKQNGFDGNKQDYWSNPIYWLLILGFLRGGGGGGLFGGGDTGATDAAVIANSAKLDCLQQGQTEALMRSLSDATNANIANLSNRVIDSAHSSEMATCNGFRDLAAQLAECCCNMRAGLKDIECGQKDIINELCKQTGLTIAAGVANTQRIVDVVNTHANTETQSKLSDCKSELSNCEQTGELKSVAAMLAAEIKECCSNSNGHGHGRGRGVVE